MKSIICERILVVTLLAFTVSLGGCGGGGSGVKTGTVQGKVQLKGQPLKSGTVFFFFAKGGDSATGAIQTDGTYTLRYNQGISVPVGDYMVSVVMDDVGGEPMDPNKLMEKIEKEGLPKLSDAIPAKYTDPKTSTLIAVVKEGSNSGTDFDLK